MHYSMRLESLLNEPHESKQYHLNHLSSNTEVRYLYLPSVI